MNVDHPVHLLPARLRICFTTVVPMTTAQVSDFVEEILNEYFARSAKARELWHHHTEAMISDEQWVEQTLEAVYEYAKERLSGAD
ncbi:MAG: hypothetical protein V4438_00375 [Patescibacteria group bacterium]